MEIHIFGPEINIENINNLMIVYDSAGVVNDTTDLSKRIINVHSQLSDYADLYDDLESIEIIDAKFELPSSSFVTIPNLLLNINEVDSGKKLASSFEIISQNKTSEFDINIFISDRDSTIESHIAINNFQADLITEIFSPSDLRVEDISISGDINLTTNKFKNDIMLDFTFVTSKGEIHFPDYWKTDLSWNRIKTKGEILNNFSLLRLDSFLIDFDGPNISFAGNISLEKSNPNIDVTLLIDNLLVKEIDEYWPYSIEHSTRQWITNHIVDGIINNATAKIKIHPEDYLQTKLPEKAIDAIVQFEQLSIDYQPPLPKVFDAIGIIHFTAESMDAKIMAGKVKNTLLDSGYVQLNGIGSSIQSIKIIGNMHGPVKDIADIIDSLITVDNDTSQLINATSGLARSQFSLIIPELSGLPFKQMNSSVISKIRNLSLPNISGFTLSGGNFIASFSNGEFKAIGNGNVNSIPMKIEWKENVYDSVQKQKKINLITNVNVDSLYHFGFHKTSFLEGNVDANIDIKIFPSETIINSGFNLNRTSIDFRQIGFTKQFGELANLIVELSLADKNPVKINRCEFLGKIFYFSGTGESDENFSKIINFDMDKLQFAQNDLSLKYSLLSSGDYEIDITGNYFDANPIINWLMESNEHALENTNFTGKLNANLKNIMIRDSIRLIDFSLKTYWDSSMVNELNASGSFESGKQLSVVYGKDNETNQLNVKADDAGLFLKGTGLYPFIEGGTLELSAKMDQFSLKAKTKADLMVNWFTLVNAPTLARILSAASIIGTVDLLNSGGIVFRKLESAFEIRDGNLFVNRSKMVGPSLGLTGEGEYDFKNNMYDFNGTIVPFNVINGLLGRIPLIGLFVDYGGIFAATYKLHGPAHNAKITVNPFSIFTPGFTRNVFEVFDTNVKSNDDSTIITK